MSDPHDKFLQPIATARVTVRLIAEETGIIAGAATVPVAPVEIGMTVSGSAHAASGRLL